MLPAHSALAVVSWGSGIFPWELIQVLYYSNWTGFGELAIGFY